MPPPAAVPAAPEGLPLPRRSVSWRVNADPAVLAAGGRALLLQVSHPAVAAGVARFSNFTADPWARLWGTLETMLSLAFGSPTQVEHQARYLTRRHARVRGFDERGRPFDAQDPETMLWVWATLVDTALIAHLGSGGRLRSQELGRLYQDACRVAEACGVPRSACPPDPTAFRWYWHRALDRLEVGDTAREIARTVVDPPRPRRIPAALWTPMVATHRALSIGLLPDRVRSAFGFDDDAAVLHTTARRAQAGFALARRTVPGPVRRAPAAWIIRAAEGR